MLSTPCFSIFHIGIKQKDENDKTEAELENPASELSWIGWVLKYSERLDLDTSSEPKQREFLKGILKKIIVKSQYAEPEDKLKFRGKKYPLVCGRM